MLKPFQYRRLLGIAAVLVAGYVFLASRLYVLQIHRHAELERKADSCFTFRRSVQALRGFILDCRGRVLAMTRPVKTVYIDPCQLGDRRAQMAQVLAPWLRMDAASLTKYLRPRFLHVDGFGESIYDNKLLLKRNVPLEEWQGLQHTLEEQKFGFDTNKLSNRDKVLLNRLRRRAIYAEDDQLRIYPNGPLAAHLVGYVGTTNGADGLVGLCGVEAAFNSFLSGTNGYYIGERDAKGVEIMNRRLAFRAPVDGAHVILTIDAVLQSIAESELTAGVPKYAAEGGAVIMVSPITGQVLALASAPGFSPDNLKAVSTNAWRNRAFDRYEPGSVFKIVTYAAGLSENLISWQHLVNAENGNYRPMGILPVVSDSSRLGVVPVLTGFVRSLNVVAAKIGIALGPERMHAYITNFGFGHSTGIGLSEERRGFIEKPANWSRTMLSRVPIGYAVDVTPLQIVMAMSTIANKGLRMQPLILNRIVDNHGTVVTNGHPQCVQRVLSEAVAQQMVAGLTAVVLSPEGTGKRAALDHYCVAGKTGTARRAKVGQAGYEPGKYRATFCGFLPASAPELCMIVVLDGPEKSFHGGQSSAPIFRRIAERAAAYMALAPDTPAPAAFPVRATAVVDAADND